MTFDAIKTAILRHFSGGARPLRDMLAVTLTAAPVAVTLAEEPASERLTPGQIAAFLTAGTMGFTAAEVAAFTTPKAWFETQAAAKPTVTNLEVKDPYGHYPDRIDLWYRAVMTGPDQLRQKINYVLSEIIVCSDLIQPENTCPLIPYAEGTLKLALGPFRDYVRFISKSQAMGFWLSHFRNAKSNPETGTHADQNFARELMQLFTIGLEKLNPDGTLMLDGKGKPIPLFTQDNVEQLANVFTGWASAPNWHSGDEPFQYDSYWSAPMMAYERFHDRSAKTIIGGVKIPSGRSAEQELDVVLDTLCNHPNCAPFMSKNLIRLMTVADPTPAYVGRVSAVWSTSKGNLLEVAKAILTDPEALDPKASKIKEPLLRQIAIFRAYNARADSGAFIDQDLQDRNRLGGQIAYGQPTVFNNFQEGRIGNLYNEASVVSIANRLGAVCQKFRDVSGNRYRGANGDRVGAGDDKDGIYIDLGRLQGLTPEQMVAELALVFTGDKLPVSDRKTLAAAAAAISDPAQRASITLQTIAAFAPQGAVT